MTQKQNSATSRADTMTPRSVGLSTGMSQCSWVKVILCKCICRFSIGIFTLYENFIERLIMKKKIFIFVFILIVIALVITGIFILRNVHAQNHFDLGKRPENLNVAMDEINAVLSEQKRFEGKHFKVCEGGVYYSKDLEIEYKHLYIADDDVYLAAGISSGGKVSISKLSQERINKCDIYPLVNQNFPVSINDVMRVAVDCLPQEYKNFKSAYLEVDEDFRVSFYYKNKAGNIRIWIDRKAKPLVFENSITGESYVF